MGRCYRARGRFPSKRRPNHQTPSVIDATAPAVTHDNYMTPDPVAEQAAVHLTRRGEADCTYGAGPDPVRTVLKGSCWALRGLALEQLRRRRGQG